MEFTIEKLVYGGDGLARIAVAQPSPAGGVAANTGEDAFATPAERGRVKAVFIPYVLPGERVEAHIVEQKTGFARAKLAHVTVPSPLRTTPPCPYFGKCGGCHYQHISYHEQLRLKTEILRETLRRTAKLEIAVEIQTHLSPPLHYRNRTRLHLRTAPEFTIGYFRHGSHELLPVRGCPISSPLINRALQNLWDFGESGKVPDSIAEIELFANGTDECLIAELHLRQTTAQRVGLRDFANDFSAALPNVHGIVAYEPTEGPSKMLTESQSTVLCGHQTMQYKVGGVGYRVSAGAFFQTNRFLISRMVDLVNDFRHGRIALDLYSGVGLFAVPLARRFERVIAVESSPLSASDLRINVPSNVKVSTQTVEGYLTSVAGTLKPSVIVADPPRFGLGYKICAHLSRLNPEEIVYLSCDPATLARDIRQFVSDGWRIAQIHLLDLFPQTFHIEACTVLRRD